MKKIKQDKSLIFAQLAGTYKSLTSLLGPQGVAGRLYPSFDKDEVSQLFITYTGLSSSLKNLNPELYSSIPERTLPVHSQFVQEGNISRSFLDKLKRDMEYIFELNSQHSSLESKISRIPKKIFISHGSSNDWMQVQSYIEKDLKVETIELAQKPNRGRTILQKLNDESDDCSYAVVVMTGDDKFSDGEIRARENVMHEIGFFQGKYGLEKVCLLHEDGTNIPSNIEGVIYIPFPKGVITATFGTLMRELKQYFKF